MNLGSGGMPARGFNLGLSCIWPLKRSSNLFELKYGKALTEKDRTPGEVPVYGTNGRCGWHSHANFKGPGVILGRKGQGPLGVEWCPVDYWVIDTAYSLRLLKDDLDLRYCYYMIKYVGLNHLKDGTSNPSLSRETFGAQIFPIPPIQEQEHIADVFTALDDKIELNRRMNETLEAMARALFKDWFVDFGPTRAKQAGMEPYLAPELWSLFPERLNAEGKPEGWVNISWKELATLEYGKRLTGYKEAVGPYPVYGTNGMIGWHTEALCDKPGIIIGRKGAYRGIHFSDSPFFVIDTAFFLKPITPLSIRWAYYTLKDHDINGMDSGSAIPSTSRDAFYQLPATLPPRTLHDAFDAILMPAWKRQHINDRKSETLAQTRDLLLPKLMSGEIRIKDAERLVESAL